MNGREFSGRLFDSIYWTIAHRHPEYKTRKLEKEVDNALTNLIQKLKELALDDTKE